jgi:hypothetical protein
LHMASAAPKDAEKIRFIAPNKHHVKLHNLCTA